MQALVSLDGFMFLLRWVHFLAGVTWIGLLYYFNFVQGSFFAEADASTKSNCIQKLVPRALWWFRWSAMFTFISGLLIIGLTLHQLGVGALTSSWGALILTGAFLATVMWANVWFVIWPSQKVVIASATQVAKGGQALPEAPACGARAATTSRTNTMFSIPMLFFMGAGRHLSGFQVGEASQLGLAAIVVGGVVLLLELNALFGKQGPMTSIKGVITCGFALWAVLFGALDILL